MRIINIFERREYLIVLFLIILNVYYLSFSYYDLSNGPSYKRYFKISLIMIVFHFLCCVFLESEFNSLFFRKMQLKLEKKIFLISLIISVPIVSNYIIGFYFYTSYIIHQLNCPFSLDQIDLKLHLKKRCDLYNINNESSYPIQYICSYNAEKNQPLKIFLKIFGRELSSIRCSKVKSLINNKVTDDFLNEYHKDDIYYCNSKAIIEKYPISINLEDCGKNVFYPEIIIILHFVLNFSFIILDLTYFKDIKANINVENYIAL